MSDAMLIDRPDTEAAPVATRPDCPTIRRSLIEAARAMQPLLRAQIGRAHV